MPKTPPEPSAEPKKKTDSPIATRIFQELGKINKRLDKLEETSRRAPSSTRSSSRNIFGEEEE